MMVIAALLWLQVQGIPAYTLWAPDGIDLATKDGAYPLQLGEDCEWLAPDMNVQLFPGTGGIAVLVSDDEELNVCHVFIGQP